MQPMQGDPDAVRMYSDLDIAMAASDIDTYEHGYRDGHADGVMEMEAKVARLREALQGFYDAFLVEWPIDEEGLQHTHGPIFSAAKKAHAVLTAPADDNKSSLDQLLAEYCEGCPLDDCDFYDGQCSGDRADWLTAHDAEVRQQERERCAGKCEQRARNWKRRDKEFSRWNNRTAAANAHRRSDEASACAAAIRERDND